MNWSATHLYWSQGPSKLRMPLSKAAAAVGPCEIRHVLCPNQLHLGIEDLGVQKSPLAHLPYTAFSASPFSCDIARPVSRRGQTGTSSVLVPESSAAHARRWT
jgi:hypothetical protein